MRITGQLLYLILLHESLFSAAALIFSYSPFLNKEICMLNHVGTCVEGWGEGGVYKFTYLLVSEIFSENTFFNL